MSASKEESVTADNTEKFQVFISHSSNDLSLVKAVINLLTRALHLPASEVRATNLPDLYLVADAVITPLGGGITNQNYLVSINGEGFVLRLGGKSTELLGIDREREHAASAIAASLGIGAEVIYSDASENLLVTRFISGQTLTPDLVAQSDMLQRVVACIRCYHEGPAFTGTFSPFDVVRNYYQLATNLGVSFPPTVPQALEFMNRIEQALGPMEEPRPCHNDLLAANFIDDGYRVRLIDWEYAAMGDPFFDLGNFSANQDLSEESCRQLLQYYFGAVKPQDLARLYLMRIVSDLRESFWGFLQSGLSSLNFDFRDYALKHLERALQNAADPRFNYLRCDHE
jgi:thiamine kinase-like enzyme